MSMLQRLAFRAMNCQMLAIVDSQGTRAGRLLAQTPGWFEVWEQHLSRFRPDSELSLINQSSGNETPVSPVMTAVLQAALRAERQSGGLVTPAVLPALEAAGYSSSFEQIPAEVASISGSEGKPARLGPGSIELGPHSVRLAAGVRLDLGGIAKGWAADEAASRLRRSGPALVNAGGDIAVSGPQANGEPWPIGVPYPCQPERQLDLLLLVRGGVATSGRDYRRWRKDGIWQHHLIDPRSGQPAQTDVLSATVVGPSTQAAEMAAKVVLILGSMSGMAWLEQRPEFAGLLVLEDGAVLRSARWNRYVWRN